MDQADDPSAGARREEEERLRRYWTHLDQLSSFLLSPSPPPTQSPCPANFGGELHTSQSSCVAVAEGTSYGAAPPPEATHGTRAGVPSPPLPLFSAPPPSLSIALDDSLLSPWDHGLLPMEDDGHWSSGPQIALWEASPHSPTALNDLLCNNNGGPAASSLLIGAAPVVEQGTSADELPRSQMTNDLPEVQAGSGWEDSNGPLRVDEQVQQLTAAAFSPPTMAADPAASAPMGEQHTSPRFASTTTISLPRDQDGIMLSGARTRRGRPKEGRPPRATKSKGRPSPVSQVVADILYGMGQDLVRQFGKFIGRMLKEEEERVSLVWRHFWRSEPCKGCSTVIVICKHCNCVLRGPYTSELLNHLKSRDNIIDPMASTTELITETDNRNCADTVTQWIPRPEYQIPKPRGFDYPFGGSRRHNHIWTLDSSTQLSRRAQWHPCCYRANRDFTAVGKVLLKNVSPWADFFIRLSESSYGPSWTTNRTHNGFTLRTRRMETGYSTWVNVVNKHSSVSASPYEDPAGGILAVRPISSYIGTSHLAMLYSSYDSMSLPGCRSWYWTSIHRVLCSLGFRKEFATGVVIYMLTEFDGCHLRFTSPQSRNRRPRSSSPLRIEDDSERGNTNNVEPGGGGGVSGKNKRKRSKVWNHFTEEVDAQGYSVGKAKCNHCGQVYRSDSATDGTSRMRRHLESKHLDSWNTPAGSL